MTDKTFVTAINCMDGRVQEPVIKWLKDKYKAEYVDMITEAGPNKIILQGEDEQIGSLVEKVGISYYKHGSGVLAIVGHHDCAGNPIDKEEKVAQIKQSIKKVKTWGYKMNIIGLYVNENWEIEQID
ncbi:carbonic anhydrase [Tenuibacillus multivorans]|uniref:Carbonic anhydrase n=1 Tax=Tenuibacillus multivorans TaxID=237069 RepID=A0A1H0AMI0_9BACI|nr:carbonic anhydrase [Tenuibacillus multivorans]GEL78187.1 hypothetical protein TMU01_24220 [Tenuibacillus multivorans]SDN34056.1 hypothetical protein SAMN05216498_1980 [Tenuibacillus multivorans]